VRTSLYHIIVNIQYIISLSTFKYHIIVKALLLNSFTLFLLIRQYSLEDFYRILNIPIHQEDFSAPSLNYPIIIFPVS